MNGTAIIKKTKHRVPYEHIGEAPNSSSGNQGRVSISGNQLGKEKAGRWVVRERENSLDRGNNMCKGPEANKDRAY